MSPCEALRASPQIPAAALLGSQLIKRMYTAFNLVNHLSVVLELHHLTANDCPRTQGGEMAESRLPSRRSAWLAQHLFPHVGDTEGPNRKGQLPRRKHLPFQLLLFTGGRFVTPSFTPFLPQIHYKRSCCSESQVST